MYTVKHSEPLIMILNRLKFIPKLVLTVQYSNINQKHRSDFDLRCSNNIIIVKFSDGYFEFNKDLNLSFFFEMSQVYKNLGLVELYCPSSLYPRILVASTNYTRNRDFKQEVKFLNSLFEEPLMLKSNKV